MPNQITVLTTPPEVVPVHNPIWARLQSDRVYAFTDASDCADLHDKPYWDVWNINVTPTEPLEGSTLTIGDYTFTFLQDDSDATTGAPCYDAYNPLHILIPAVWTQTGQRAEIVRAINNHPDARRVFFAVEIGDTLTLADGSTFTPSDVGTNLRVVAKTAGVELSVSTSTSPASSLSITQVATGEYAPSEGTLRENYKLLVTPRIEVGYHNSEDYLSLATLSAPAIGPANQGLDLRAETDFVFDFNLSHVLNTQLTDDIPTLTETGVQLCYNAIRNVRWDYGEVYDSTESRRTEGTSFRVLNCVRNTKDGLTEWTTTSALDVPDTLEPYFATLPADGYRRFLVDTDAPPKRLTEGEHEWLHFWVPANETAGLGVYVDRTYKDGTTDVYDPEITFVDILGENGYNSDAEGHLVRIPLTDVLDDAWADNLAEMCAYIGAPVGLTDNGFPVPFLPSNGSFWRVVIPGERDTAQMEELELGSPRISVPSNNITQSPDDDCGGESTVWYNLPNIDLSDTVATSSAAAKQAWLNAGREYAALVLAAWPEATVGNYPVASWYLANGQSGSTAYLVVDVYGIKDTNLTYTPRGSSAVYDFGVCVEGIEAALSQSRDAPWYYQDPCYDYSGTDQRLGGTVEPCDVDDNGDVVDDSDMGHCILVDLPGGNSGDTEGEGRISNYRTYKPIHRCGRERLTIAYRNTFGVMDTLHLAVQYQVQYNYDKTTARFSNDYLPAQPKDNATLNANPKRERQRETITLKDEAVKTLVIQAGELTAQEAKHLQAVLRSPRLWVVEDTTTPDTCNGVGGTTTELVPVYLASDEHVLEDTNTTGLLEVEFELAFDVSRSMNY